MTRPEVTQVASEVVKGLQSSPVLLALISLNLIMVGGAVWFLRALAAAQQARFDILMKVCLGGDK